MAARNGKKKAVRRRKQGIKLLNIAETFVQGNIITQGVFGTNPVSFVFGDAGPTFAVGGGGISIVELVRDPSLLETVGSRLMQPERVLTMGLKSAGANVAFRFGRRFLRNSINRMNRDVFTPLNIGVKL